MSQWDKLINRILVLSNDLRFEELQKVMEAYGYTVKAPSKGSSHRIFRKPGAEPVTIPKANRIKRVYVELVRDVIEKENKHE